MSGLLVPGCLYPLRACVSVSIVSRRGRGWLLAVAATTAGACPGIHAGVHPCNCDHIRLARPGGAYVEPVGNQVIDQAWMHLGNWNTKAVIIVLSVQSSHRSEALYYATTVLKQHGCGINFICQETKDYSLCKFLIFFWPLGLTTYIKVQHIHSNDEDCQTDYMSRNKGL